MKRLLFKLRLFKHQFHPFCGIDVVHQLNENGAYECSYFVLTKLFSSEVLLRIRYNRNDIYHGKREANWMKKL